MTTFHSDFQNLPLPCIALRLPLRADLHVLAFLLHPRHLRTAEEELCVRGDRLILNVNGGRAHIRAIPGRRHD